MTEPQATEALLPCPFCGEKEPEVFQSQTDTLWYVSCGTCDVTTGPKFIEDDGDQRLAAIAAWNTRPPVSEDAARLDDVERVAEIFSDYVAWRRWGSMAEDRADLRQKVRSGDFDVNEPTKHDCREAARAAIAALSASPSRENQ